MDVQRLFDLTGQVALVTGGSRGLGEEMAEGLAEAGASLMLLARREQWLTPTIDRLRGSGYRCEGMLCDVANPIDVEAAVRATMASFGRIDILVNNAGVSWGAPAEEMPLDKWRMVIDINLTGAFLFAQAAGKEMIRQGSGSILNIASVAGLRGTLPGSVDFSGYVASKGGLIALTRELAAKWGKHGVRVNALAPGFFPSRMTEKVLDRIEADVARSLPLGRIGSAGELKGVAVFLCSAAAAYITGQVLAVDGGMTAV
jgi:NAD(P)-dependent dehydrogenase (short-subunit alcohol dehydrogenase family)